MSSLGHRAAVWPANVLRVLRPVSSLGHRAAGWPPCRCTPIYDLLLVLRPVSIQSEAGARSSGLRRCGHRAAVWPALQEVAVCIQRGRWEAVRVAVCIQRGRWGLARSCSLHPTLSGQPCKKLQVAPSMPVAHTGSSCVCPLCTV